MALSMKENWNRRENLLDYLFQIDLLKTLLIDFYLTPILHKSKHEEPFFLTRFYTINCLKNVCQEPLPPPRIQPGDHGWGSLHPRDFEREIWNMASLDHILSV